MGENPTAFPAAGEDAAVDRVSWEDAVEFCQRLTMRDHASGALPLGWSYRLPNEAQWEFACRADEEPPASLQDVAWYADNAAGRPHPVGRKAPNAWGFFDMLGNVWE